MLSSAAAPPKHAQEVMLTAAQSCHKLHTPAIKVAVVAVLKVTIIEGICDGTKRILMSRKACSKVPPNQTQAHWLKPSVWGCTTSNTPAKPVAMMSQLPKLTLTPSSSPESRAISKGVAMLMAVALAKGI